MGLQDQRGEPEHTHHDPTDVLLSTKLTPPYLNPNFIPRQALLARLEKGLEQKLILVSAPAGFGKTTLVSSWLEQGNLLAAWLSLDEDDSDFTRFWNYFIGALQTIQPAVGIGMLAMLRSSPLPHSHTLLTLLLNDLATIQERFFLVLDDYHAIESASIDQALAFFIDHLPPLMHLVIISRADPNLPVARLRANGQLNELRSADLRFSPAETAQFLEQMTGLSFSADELAALDQRTEGWIAGLQMAAIALRSYLSLSQREPAAISQFIEDFSGSHRYIMDYLMDEVLQQQPIEVQTFLLYTSILDRMCAPLCDAILGDKEQGIRDSPLSPIPYSLSREILEFLDHSNLFIYPLDDQRLWYRYHPLFASLLRLRLHQTHPDRVASLHLRASQWYEHAGFTGSAVQHALAAEAFDRAANLVEQVAPKLIQRSELAQLLSWFDALPVDEVQARPRLALYQCWSLFLNGQIKQAADQLEAVEARLAGDEANPTPEVQSHIAAIRAYLVRETGDFGATIAFSQQALAHLPEQDTLLRAMVNLNLAIAHYLQGELDLASQLLIENITAGQTAELMANTLSAIYLKAQILRAKGSLQQALQLCQEELALVNRHGWQNFPAAGFVFVALGDLLRERNELDAAEEYLEKGINLGQEGAHPHIMIIGYVWLAWLRQTLKNTAGCQDAVRAALHLIQQYQVSRFWPLPPADCCQARLWIAQGNLTEASRWVEESRLNLADSQVSFRNEVDNLALARLLIAQNDLETAGAWLLRLYQSAASADRNGSLIEILILQAISFAAQKRDEEALSALDHALRLAEPEGFVRIFLDEGAPMVELLRRAVAQGRHADYALRLLQAAGEAVAASQSLIEPLSERELEVLRRVAAGYSNQEIAQELVLAVSTVKKHINNIYGKLGVVSRTQAAARARELGLL